MGRLVDRITYTSVIRAAGFCRPLTYSLQLLEVAFKDIGTDILQVVHTAMINLKYVERNLPSASRFTLFDQKFTLQIEYNNVNENIFKQSPALYYAEIFYQWLLNHNVTPNAQTMVRIRSTIYVMLLMIVVIYNYCDVMIIIYII